MASDDDSGTQSDNECLQRFVEKYPDPVATILGEGTTTFERWEQEKRDNGLSEWHPFGSKDEWELAAWLAQNVGHNKIEDFLQLEMIKKCGLTVSSKYTFFQKLDQLPQRPSSKWICDKINVVGDLLGEDGIPMSEELELWRRNPVDCVRELIGNPAFCKAMEFSPERVFSDEKGENRVIDEMWTADWWWRAQASHLTAGSLPSGATVAPIILASDKTKLSNFRGDQTAWPVYLSIGNIAKAVRRQVSSRATVLLGYIPVSKLTCFSASHETRRLAGYRLYHHCMKSILEPLIDAGKLGVDMVCADGYVRKIFPIIAAYVADHPEQCLIVNVQENHCPRGKIPPNRRGEPDGCLLRSVEETVHQLNHHKSSGGINALPNGLRSVYEPFWAALPQCDIFSCITPDILHQLHKGVFKDHLVSWIAAVVGDDELDRRFKAMANVPGIRHFKKGISHVQQWTGTEYKEMQKVFVTLVAGAVNSEVLTVVQTLIDFIYYAQLHQHTSRTLEAMRDSLAVFHRHKAVFEDLNIRKHFNIAKIHAMVHYTEAIEEKGSLDGYNTELSERLHIDFAKAGYRAGNHRDYIAHMTTWLSRQEAVRDRREFQKWLAEALQSDTINYDNDSPVDDTDIRFLPTYNPRSYQIAKKSPLRGITLAHLETHHSASDFLSSLQRYVRIHYADSPFRPTVHGTYNIYKQIKIRKPPSSFVSGKALSLEKVRAIAPTMPRGRTNASAGAFDPVLVIEDVSRFKVAGTSTLDGLRLARLRVIFEVPAELGRAAHPLAYIEWYTPFQRSDLNTRLYQVSRSSRNHRPHAEIVEVDRIVGLCHLAAKCGTTIDPGWTTDNVLDRAQTFHVNPYLSLYTWGLSGLYSKSACLND
ncbi:hypothetical protein BDW22DRAFT_1331469 [Trametopsis cervina]|nr:hypothetical protein BDW22DRAFT_1331469 [Trametopsis cervina]